MSPARVVQILCEIYISTNIEQLTYFNADIFYSLVMNTITIFYIIFFLIKKVRDVGGLTSRATSWLFVFIFQPVLQKKKKLKSIGLLVNNSSLHLHFN